MSNKSPAFQWYPKDILSSVRVQMMSLAEEGAYRRLLDFCWINGWIPNDAKKIANIIGKGCSLEIAKNIIDMFTVDPDDENKLIHDRLEDERAKQESNSQARRSAAAARWNKQGTSNGDGKSGKPADVRGKRDEAENTNGKQVNSKTDANAMQTDMQNDALHTSISTSKQEKDLSIDKSKKKGTRIPENFALTEEMIEWATEHTPFIEVRLEFEQFRNHFVAKSGANGVKLDWMATWKNWMLRAETWRKERNGNKKQSNAEILEEWKHYEG